MTKKTQRAKARAEKKPRIGEEHIRPDGSVIRYVREEDDNQKPVDHYRTVDTLALMLAQAAAQEGLHHHTALPINTMTDLEPGEHRRTTSCRACRDSYLHAHRS